MEVGGPKCCEGLKFIAKLTATERFPSRQTPADLHSSCTSSAAPSSAAAWGGGPAEFDQQRRREDFFKRVVRQLLIRVVGPSESEIQDRIREVLLPRRRRISQPNSGSRNSGRLPRRPFLFLDHRPRAWGTSTGSSTAFPTSDGALPRKALPQISPLRLQRPRRGLSR